jgi:hypothetical protein
MILNCETSAAVIPFLAAVSPLNTIHHNEIAIVYAGWPRSMHQLLQSSTPAKPS